MKQKLFLLVVFIMPQYVHANCDDVINNVNDGASIKKALICLNNKQPASINNNVASLPIGTIIGSMVPPANFEQQYGHSWILADGSRLATTSKYHEVTGNNRLPDLRGVFLRGANAARADGKGDPLGDSRGVGSFQEHSTALPKQPFTGNTAITGEHSHTYDRARPYNSGAGGHDRAKHSGKSGTTAASGKHNHAFTVSTGGDPETRPPNVSVYFYIKVE